MTVQFPFNPQEWKALLKKVSIARQSRLRELNEKVWKEFNQKKGGKNDL